MIIDYDKDKFEGSSPYDVCIIGGGPAGISLAVELDELDIKVCLVESGGTTTKRKNQKLNKVLNLGIPYRNLSVQRARYLGGCSNLWGGNCIPLDPIDFKEVKARMGSFWPFTHASLEKFVTKAQSLLGLDSSEFGDELLKKIKITSKGDNKLFDWKAWQFCDFPFRFGDKFHTQLSVSKNITVLLNANIVDFNVVDGGCEAKAAVIRSLSGKTELVKASNFVLACGGIENARILLNLVDKNVLADKHKFIGKCFAEHPNATIGYLEGENASQIYEQHKIKYLNGTKEVKPGLGISEKAQKENCLLNGIVSVWSVPLANSAIIRAKLLLELFRRKEFGIKFLVNTFMVLPGIVSLLPHVRHRLKGGEVSIPYRTDRFEVRLMAETVANPESRVSLTDQLDTTGLKIASLDWKLTDQDRNSFVSIANLAKNHFDQMDGVELVLDSWVNDYDIDWTKLINTDGHYGHHMGTTKMGLSSRDSVVDEDCKVHGIDNLYVAGSSVFPTFGFANPTLTIVALSIKLANHLKQKLTNDSI